MANAPSASNVMLGRGAIYFDRRTTTDNTVGSFHLGNCDQFGVNITTEKLTLIDNTQQSSSPYKEVVVETAVAINISGFEFSKENMALATMGANSTLTQAAASIAGEVLASATVTNLLGKYFFLSKRDVSNVVLKQGATTHTVDDDYEIVDAARGLIRILPDGDIADGTALTADYDHAAILTASALDLVFGGTSAAIEGKLRFISNNTTGPNWDFVAWNASLRPNGDIAFLSGNEFNKFTLEGTAQSDATGTYGGSSSSPYYTLTKAA